VINHSLYRTPKKLKQGDTIKVVSPAGQVEKDALIRGIEVIESWGYRVEIGKHVLDTDKYFAGSSEARLTDLISALIDESISAIICSRGGYGSVRLLNQIPWELLAEREPKMLIGFSDIGAFQLALLKMCGWVSFSGPQVASIGNHVDNESIDYLRSLIPGREESNSMNFELETVKDGDFNPDAVVIPSCLSMMLSLIGTPYFPDLSGSIVCIEDVNEPLYRIDRMLWQLKTTGTLESMEALILGQFLLNGQDISEEVARVAIDLFGEYGFPILNGLPYGHGRRCMTLPVGGRTQLLNNIAKS